MKTFAILLVAFLSVSPCRAQGGYSHSFSKQDLAIYILSPQIILFPLSYFSKFEDGGKVIGTINFITGIALISYSLHLFYRPEFSRFGDIEKYAYLFGGIGLIGQSIFTFSNFSQDEISHSRFLANYFGYNSILLFSVFLVHNARINAGSNYLQLQIEI